MGALEMEKNRQLTERKCILEKLEQIDRRCQEIEQEQAMLQKIGSKDPYFNWNFTHFTEDEKQKVMDTVSEQKIAETKKPEPKTIKKKKKVLENAPSHSGFRIKY